MRSLLTAPVIAALVFIGGIAVVAAGVALIYLPAGLIVAGGAAAACAVLYVRGAR